jgi:hypothetical protein
MRQQEGYHAMSLRVGYMLHDEVENSSEEKRFCALSLCAGVVGRGVLSSGLSGVVVVCVEEETLCIMP